MQNVNVNCIYRKSINQIRRISQERDQQLKQIKAKLKGMFGLTKE